MDRVLQNQPATLSAVWEVGGVVIDPGAGVTALVTYDSDGHTVAPTVTGSGTGGRSITLTPAQTAHLDSLTIRWTATDTSILTTYAEISGGFMFSVQRARLRSPLQDTATYTTEQILYYRTLAEMALEDLCGVAFVPRYTRETMSVTGYGMLETSRRKIRNVIQITSWMNNAQVALPSLSGLQIVGTDSVFLPTLWNWFSLPIYMAYEHGYNEAPPRVQRAALELCRRWLVESPWDERATGFRTRDGGEMSILTANHTDPFDIPEVVAVADAYGTPLIA